jgi:quinol monooxygenase YgiN
LIIVIGSIVVEQGRVDEALKISQQHVDRSRTEPGCISHGVHIDAENLQRLVFVEEWEDMDALSQHFRVAASIDFIKDIEAMATEAAVMSIFDATPMQ